jgi:hypothetical protein
MLLVRGASLVHQTSILEPQQIVSLGRLYPNISGIMRERPA